MNLNKLWFTYIVNFGFSFPLHTDISVDCIFPCFFFYLMTIFSFCIFYLLKNVHNTKNITLICELKLNIRLNNNWECNVFLLFSCAHSTLYYIFFFFFSIRFGQFSVMAFTSTKAIQTQSHLFWSTLTTQTHRNCVCIAMNFIFYSCAYSDSVGILGVFACVFVWNRWQHANDISTLECRFWRQQVVRFDTRWCQRLEMKILEF